MPGFKLKNYKPFECDIIEVDSVLVKKVLINFGTVICTASNSLANYFIPKIEGKELIRSNEDNFLENNTLSINGGNGSSSGCIALKINLKDFQDEEIQEQWYSTFIRAATGKFKPYIEKYVLPSMIKQRITSNLDEYNYGDESTGLTKKTLVEIDNLNTTVQGIANEKKALEGSAYIWRKENSAYYKLIDVANDGVTPIDLATLPYNAKPLDICFDHNLFPLVNISNIIESVDIEFIEISEGLLYGEKLNLFNLIENNIKYIAIAWINNGSLEQIVDFDYIYCFPNYFLVDKAKPFKTTT
jgi:hypothetical protein